MDGQRFVARDFVVRSDERLTAFVETRIGDRRCSGTATSGHLGQDLIHLGGRESTHGLRTDVTQHIRSQQNAGSRLVVRDLEDALLGHIDRASNTSA